MSDNRRKNIKRDAYGKSTTSRRSGGPVRTRATGGRAYTTNRTNMPRRRAPLRRAPVRRGVSPVGRGTGITPRVSRLTSEAMRDCPTLLNNPEMVRSAINQCPGTQSVAGVRQIIDDYVDGWAEVCCFLSSFVPGASARCCDKAKGSETTSDKGESGTT
jgi:hypothetical protein